LAHKPGGWPSSEARGHSSLRNWHNHFDNYGNLMPGYCGGISLGRWQGLDRLIEESIDLETHPVLKLLIAGDMQWLPC